MGRRSTTALLAWIAVGAAAVFVALVIAVSAGGDVAIDTRAFDVAEDLRTPGLDTVARVITTFGLLVIVGPAVALGAALLYRRGHPARALALLAGAAATWVATTVAKVAIDRARPAGALVHTTGASYPSGHAANAVGWLALAIAVSVLITHRGRRMAAIAAGASLAVLVGLSRVYLRAHYATDVLGAEALAVAMYALAAIGALRWRDRRVEMRSREPGR